MKGKASMLVQRVICKHDIVGMATAWYGMGTAWYGRGTVRYGMGTAWYGMGPVWYGMSKAQRVSQ